MGTEKRDRQRANKAMKQQQVARAESRHKSTRLAVIVIGAIVGVFAIAYVANTFIGDDDDTATPPQSEATLPPVQDDEPAAATSDDAVDDDETVEDDQNGSQAGAVDDATGEFIPDGCPPSEGTADQTQSFDSAPQMCLDPDVSYSALISTNKGDVTVQLDQAKAPTTVNNFVFLARNKYFDETVCHRIIPGFVVQCGDPDATGLGNPGYQFDDELPELGDYQLGSIVMANSGPNTNGSQFFIITGEQGVQLPPQYALFGQVTAGFDDAVIDMEAAGTSTGEPSEPVEINSITIQVG